MSHSTFLKILTALEWNGGLPTLALYSDEKSHGLDPRI
jgi:hypothetical protein